MFDAEEKVLDILVDVREKEIERLENINDSINDGNDRLMKSIQNSIDKMRRDRDNEKTEETLAEKERRLAYLKQDTSGRNALEIKQLEKELKGERESYKDTLVDQSIDDIQSSMDEASEQRERQIEILNKQLEAYQESGKAMVDVHKLMAEAINPDGSINESSNLFKLLEASSDYQAASNQKRDFLLGELVQAVKNYGTYLGTSSTLKDAVKEGFVTGYASGEYNEDFAEVYANYVTSSDESWKARLDKGIEYTVTGLNAKGETIQVAFWGKPTNAQLAGAGFASIKGAKITSREGANIINAKLEIVRSYLQDSWGIDLEKLRAIVLRRSAEVMNMDLTTLN